MLNTAALSLSYLPNTLNLIQQIEVHQQSDKAFDRQVRTRFCVTELFLRIVFNAMKEALTAIAKIPFAAVKLGLDRVNLGHLSPTSMTFGEVVNHVKLSKQFGTAVLLDSFETLIHPNSQDLHSRLVNRGLIQGQIQQIKPTLFESLLKHVWTHKVLLGSIALAVITIIAFKRLDLFSSLISQLTTLFNIQNKNLTNLTLQVNETISLVNGTIINKIDPTFIPPQVLTETGSRFLAGLLTACKVLTVGAGMVMVGSVGVYVLLDLDILKIPQRDYSEAVDIHHLHNKVLEARRLGCTRFVIPESFGCSERAGKRTDPNQLEKIESEIEKIVLDKQGSPLPGCEDWVKIYLLPE